MIARIATLLTCLIAPQYAAGEDAARFEQAMAAVETGYFELIDEYLGRACPEEAAAFDAVFGQSAIATAYWSEAVEMFEVQVKSVPELWSDADRFIFLPGGLLDSSAVNAQAYLTASAIYVTEALVFMNGFHHQEGETTLSVSELHEMRPGVISASNLQKCLRSAEPASNTSVSAQLRRDIIEASSAADRCIHFDVFVQRYLGIPIDALTIAERHEAGIDAMREHALYMKQAGMAAECEEMS